MKREEYLWLEIESMIYYPNLHGVSPHPYLSSNDVKRLYTKLKELKELLEEGEK